MSQAETRKAKKQVSEQRECEDHGVADVSEPDCYLRREMSQNPVCASVGV